MGLRGDRSQAYGKSKLLSPIAHVIDLAHIHTLLGEPEKAVAELESLLSRPGWISVPWLKMDPRWSPLRGNPHFEALLAKCELKA